MYAMSLPYSDDSGSPLTHFLSDVCLVPVSWRNDHHSNSNSAIGLTLARVSVIVTDVLIIVLTYLKTRHVRGAAVPVINKRNPQVPLSVVMIRDGECATLWRGNLLRITSCVAGSVYFM